ncbi:MAG: hypothetical protein JXA15_13955, partial [Spirochaetales bacterium]|nr:hypothetical protein [Spirochaetales bacterium]
NEGESGRRRLRGGSVDRRSLREINEAFGRSTKPLCGFVAATATATATARDLQIRVAPGAAHEK